MVRQFVRSHASLVALRKWLLQPYFALRYAWPVWWSVLNREARRLYVAHPPTFTPLQERLVLSLQRTGLAETTLDELFNDTELLGRLQAYANSLRSQAKPRNRKTYMLELFETYPTFDLQNPFIRLSLERQILDVVNGYLSLCTRLHFLGCDVTETVPAGSPKVYSQRWHRDPEDRRMCKVFIYLNDVGSGSGPFHYVLGSQDGGRWRSLFPQRPSYGYYPPDGAVEQHIPVEDIKQCTGKAGAIVFCDTSGLHRGGYATESERLMFTAGYLTPASVWQIRYRPPTEEQKGLIAHDPVTRFALTGLRVPREFRA